jgi:aspartate aminotransferase
MKLISDKLSYIKPSPTLEITQKAEMLKRSGIDIVSLSVGEPDFLLTDNIKQSIVKALQDNKTRYTATDGIIELKEAIAEKYNLYYQLQYKLDEVIVSSGGKQVIYNLFLSTLNQYDEVIIPSPYWVSYTDIVSLCEGTPIIVECSEENDFKLTPELLEANITDKTKWVVINSPSNPTGSVYSKEELLGLVSVLLKYPNIQIMSDDIYEHILYDCEFFNIAMLSKELKDRVFIVSGVSKTYSMTGLRIGYGLGNSKIIKAMKIIQSQSTSNPSSISQYGALEALIGDQSFINLHNTEFKKRLNYLFTTLNAMEGITLRNKPKGAFYVFPSCKGVFGKKTPNGNIIKNSNDFAAYLLEFGEVAVVPGIAFGAEGYFRISFATSLAMLEKACTKINSALAKLV